MFSQPIYVRYNADNLTSAHTSGEDVLTPRGQLPLLALIMIFTASLAADPTRRMCGTQLVNNSGTLTKSNQSPVP